MVLFCLLSLYLMLALHDLLLNFQGNIKPKFETLKNVTLVSDIKPYEKIKIRCLNGGHSALGYAGFLAGFPTIDETANDETFEKYLRLYFKEVSVTLDAVEGIELPQYQDDLVERFSNMQVKDDVLRICKDGSSKIPGFVLPTVTEALEKGESSTCLSFVIASWINFIEKQKLAGAGLDDGEETALFDLVEKMSAANNDVRVFLGERRLFGDLCDSEVFVTQVQLWHSRIAADGVMDAMNKLLAESSSE
jgi:mannitol 2-dehydrogenase